MYRIHFTAAGVLRTERAVMEFGPDGVRWRFGDQLTPVPSTPPLGNESGHARLLGSLGFDEAWRVRREHLLILLVRLRRLARQQIGSLNRPTGLHPRGRRRGLFQSIHFAARQLGREPGERMTLKTSHTQPVSDQDRRRLRQLKTQLASAGLLLAGGLIAYLELGVLAGGGLLLAGLALLLLTPRI